MSHTLIKFRLLWNVKGISLRLLRKFRGHGLTNMAPRATDYGYLGNENTAPINRFHELQRLSIRFHQFKNG